MARQQRESNVVDLLRYRSARVSKPLPLFDTVPLSPLSPPGDVPRLVTISPFRVLSAREVSHRARMLAHLRVAPRARAGLD
jgi:hypothetical protein